MKGEENKQLGKVKYEENRSNCMRAIIIANDVECL